jgi:hypothetical protein
MWEMPATSEFRIFCLPVSYLTTQNLKYTKLYFYLYFVRVPQLTGRTYTESIWEEGAEENISI